MNGFFGELRDNLHAPEHALSTLPLRNGCLVCYALLDRRGCPLHSSSRSHKTHPPANQARFPSPTPPLINQTELEREKGRERVKSTHPPTNTATLHLTPLAVTHRSSPSTYPALPCPTHLPCLPPTYLYDIIPLP